MHRKIDPDTGTDTPEDESRQAGAESRIFLHIHGMHCATCEIFLESIAEGCEGVTDAAASYVTETISVTYDPDRISVEELCDALSTLGYTATLRDSSSKTGSGNARTRTTTDRNGIEEMLGFRYAAGVIFGSFVLLPYVVIFYPAQLSAYYRAGSLDLFGGSSGGGLLVLPVFLILTGVVVFFTGLPLLRGAYVSLKMRQPNTDLLVSVTVVSAYVYSTIAFFLGRIDVYYDLSIVVAAGVVAAIFYESLTKRRSFDLLSDLTISHVDEAHRYDGDGTTTAVAVEDLERGDRVLVREGERIPVDGVLADDACTVDEAVVTGESLPVVKHPGDDVVGGAVVTNGAATITVSDGTTSSIDRIIASVWDLQSANHGIQRRSDRFASVVVPLLVGVAVVLGLTTILLDSTVQTAVLASLTVLLVGSPWAVGLATPLSVASSLEDAMRRGIVVSDETVFERLRNVDTVVFDKTGTLTTGRMDVLGAELPSNLLPPVVALERRASHPVADAVTTAFATGTQGASDSPGGNDGRSENTDRVPVDHVREFTTHSNGVEGVVDGTRVLVGNLDFFSARGWEISEAIENRAAEARNLGRLPVLVGRDGDVEGIIVVGDEPRTDWGETISRVSDRGRDVVVLTGDSMEAADFLADHEDVEHVFAGVPPAGKTEAIRRLQSRGRVTMVGDGTNDAPALAAADLGISLGSGTALASDAADIAIVDDDLTAVGTSFDLAHAARRRLTQNYGLALLYNGITIPLAAVGSLNPLFAMIAVVTSGSLIAANSFRDILDE